MALAFFRYFSFFIIIFWGSIAFSQETPPIQVYLPSTYKSENQNWAISQSEDKTIHVANNKGLLEFNGAKWTLYPSPNNTIIRTVKAIDSLIYTGSFREFGYWSRNKFGKLSYFSLSTSLNVPFLENEEIWNIIDIDDWVLFQSLNRIYIFNTKTEQFETIESEATINKMFKVDNSIYFQKLNGSLYEIINGKAILVSKNRFFQENLIVKIFKKENNLLLLTEDNGFYFLNEGQLEQWSISANTDLNGIRIYSAMRLADSSFLLGSISDGMLLISNSGDIKLKLNQNSGLSNNTVLSVFQDKDYNLWLGLEYGINCINLRSPLRIYNDYKGKIGAVNTSILFNGYLYLGTNQGLFYKKYNSSNAYQFIEGTQGAVWCLKNIQGHLFCGHNSGTYLIEKGAANLISNIQGTWDIKPFKKQDNLFLQGNYTGLYVLENSNGTWKVRNKIDGFDVSSRYFEFISENKVIVNHEYKGVFKLTLDKACTKALKIERETSLEKGLKTSLVEYQGDILYAHKKGIYKYHKAQDVFIRDSLYSQLFTEDEYTSGKLIVDKATNKLWATSSHGLSFLSPRKLSSLPKINRIPIPSNSRNDVSGYENITYLNKNEYLFGNSRGYIVFNLDKIEQPPFQVNIALISNSRFKNKDSIKLIDKSVKGELLYTENTIEFDFNVPEYEKYIVPEYQYKLEGIYNTWSRWSTKSHELFENLPYGDYTFKVRAKIGNTPSSNVESYSFKVLRPWYISNLMLALYFVVLLLFSGIMHNLYKQYYKKQREKLLLKKQRELELKELENKEQKARFKNEKLQQDIENKNRELGISTMNLIKKNELLNNLKKELQNINDVKSIKKVIRIIDQNINNTDDWKLFEEAFNNADKDFLKKIKQIHPELTSNDLRLCAYLRLNLSSKEIAPLLNISPRSVEVKRYRLRKKMNLKHEVSLADYILEI